MVRIQSNLLDKYGWADFRDAVFSGRTRGDLIVAIARKMPRLLEYFDCVDESNSSVVTERALPWIQNDELSKIHALFCDDILNVGTTIGHYTDYALGRGLKQASIVTYARRKKKQSCLQQKQLEKYDLKVIECFEEQSYWRFETALPQLLLSIGKPYDLDFPIISIPLSQSEASRSIEEWLSLLRQFYPTVHDLTTPTQRKANIASFTLSEPIEFSLESLICVHDERFPPIIKIRLYIDADSRKMRIVPMCIPIIPAPAFHVDNILVDPDLLRLYTKLRGRSNEGSPFPFEPLFNLVVYLLSYEYGRLFFNQFKQLLVCSGDRRPTLSIRDLVFIFGQDVALELQKVLGSRLLRPTNEVAIRRSESLVMPNRGPLNPDLVQQVILELKKRKYKGAPVTELLRESLRVLDDIVGANDPNESQLINYVRLRVGFSLCDLWWIAQKMCTKEERPTFVQLSFLLDYYIDLGVIVPVVGFVDNSYCRVYRRGEADPMEYAKFIHRLLQEHEQVYPKYPLTTTQFTKILAIQKILHPDLVPLDPVFDFMGTVTYWSDPRIVERHTIKAVDFLYDMGAITYDEPKKKIVRSLFD